VNLSEAQIKVLGVLYDDSMKFDRQLGPGYIGDTVWGKNRKPQAYARTAGKVLNALQEKRLVSYSVVNYGFHKDWGWSITSEGIKKFEEIERAEKAKDKKGNDRVPE